MSEAGNGASGLIGAELGQRLADKPLPLSLLKSKTHKTPTQIVKQQQATTTGACCRFGGIYEIMLRGKNLSVPGMSDQEV